MEKKNEEIKRQALSKILEEEIQESELENLLAILDIIDNIKRRERRPTYTSYFVNMAVNSE